MIEQKSYEVGDWIVDTNGKTRCIYSDNQPDLPYEMIKGKLEGDEVPEFNDKLKAEDLCEINIGSIQIRRGLDKGNFFDYAKLHCPLAFDLFSQWIDKYKMITHWDFTFRISRKTSRKFHEVSFDIQLGILLNFFTAHSVSEYRREVPYDSDIHEWAELFSSLFCDIEVDLRNKDYFLSDEPK